jgi:hypothetical protein
MLGQQAGWTYIIYLYEDKKQRMDWFTRIPEREEFLVQLRGLRSLSGLP